VRRLLPAVVAALVLAAPALGSDRHPTLAELESRIMCPICHTTLDQSDSPIAKRMKAFISQRIAAGDTTSQIEDRLVAQFGPAVLASPSHKGLNLLVWVLPPVGIVLAAIVLAVLAFRWTRSREPAAAADPALDPELERRLDEELARFDH
jgi:cytochrome c-type biogenesis protein CcmH